MNSLLSFVLLLLTIRATASPLFNVIPVGLDSVAGINDKGQIVGTIDTKNQHPAEASPYMDFAEVALWQAGKIKIVGTYQRQPDCTPAAINNQGEIVGRADKADHFPGDGDWSDIHLFRRREGRFFPLTDSGEVLGMNDLGQAVGFRVWPDGEYGFVAWHGRIKEVRNPLSSDFCEITSINNTSLMAGVVYLHIGPPNWVGGSSERHYAYLWPPTGKPYSLESLPNLIFSEALGVNDAGQVVGYVHFKDDWSPNQMGRHTFYKDHAFLWFRGKMMILDQPNVEVTRPIAINDAGDIVGEARFPTGKSGGFQGGFFLYKNGVLYNLKTLLPMLSHWELESISGMNNRGQIIGSGRYNGKTRSFLLTPTTKS